MQKQQTMKYGKKTIGPQEISKIKQYAYDVLAGEREPKPMQAGTAGLAIHLCLQGVEVLEKREITQKKAIRHSAFKRTNNAQRLKMQVARATEKCLAKDPELTTKELVEQLAPDYKRAESTLARIIAPVVKRHRNSWSNSK